MSTLKSLNNNNPPPTAMKVVKIVYMTCMVLSMQGIVNILRVISDHPQQTQSLNVGTIDVPAEPRRSLLRVQDHSRPSVRVLFGIFSHDSMEAAAYRWNFRKLFETFHNAKDYRVCSLWELEQATLYHNYFTKLQEPGISEKDQSRLEWKLKKVVEYEHVADVYEQCSFVYTFVVGGNLDEDAPTVLLDDSIPITTGVQLDKRRVSRDVRLSNRKHKFGDMTLLNIKENMNEGKSQTWFYYASNMAEEMGEIEYIAKIDSDALPYMDLFFEWALEQHRLPPSPYNTNILVGNPVDKYWWFTDNRIPGEFTFAMTQEEIDREEFFHHVYYNHFHIYVQGQCYILSVDLAKFVAKEAAAIKYVDRRPKETNFHIAALNHRYNYTENHEDHDVSSMAFHSPHPIQLQVFTRFQKFWRHPIKNRRNEQMQFHWDTEIQRMEKWIPLHHNKAMEGMEKDANGWFKPISSIAANTGMADSEEAEEEGDSGEEILNEVKRGREMHSGTNEGKVTLE